MKGITGVALLIAVVAACGGGGEGSLPEEPVRREPAPTPTEVGGNEVWLIQDQPPCRANEACDFGVYIGPAYYSIGCDNPSPDRPEEATLYGSGDAAATEARSVQGAEATDQLALRLAADTCPTRQDRWVLANGLLLDG